MPDKTTFRLRNTLGGRIEPFQPRRAGEVRMYTCGLTVYARGHIGNFRFFVAQDILRRYLRFKGYRVLQAMNFTDVDDKTIRGALAAGEPLRDYTTRFIEQFFEDADALGIERVEHYPRATDPEYIEAMIRLVTRQLAQRPILLARATPHGHHDDWIARLQPADVRGTELPVGVLVAHALVQAGQAVEQLRQDGAADLHQHSVELVDRAQLGQHLGIAVPARQRRRSGAGRRRRAVLTGAGRRQYARLIAHGSSPS